MNTLKIKSMYELAALIEKAQKAAANYQFISDGRRDIYNHYEIHNISVLDHWDNEAKKAEANFRKSCKALLSYFGVPVINKWSGKELKKADIFDYRNACNELLSHEYGIYRNRLNWEQIDLIKQVDRMSDYTTNIIFE